MPTTTQAAAAAVPTTGRGTRRGPVRRIIVGSLFTGAVLAAVLPLVVFAGASEPVVPGSALLGFAAGCTLLAALSGLMTARLWGTAQRRPLPRVRRSWPEATG